jgi:hypothetical protein
MAQDNLFDLTDLLFRVPVMKTTEGRERVTRDLPITLASGISHSNTPSMHIRNILDRCLTIPGGLRRLLDMLARYEGSTNRDLKRAVQMGVLVDLFEIVRAEVGDSEVASVIQRHLPDPSRMNAVGEVWPQLLALWKSREAHHPILTLIDNLSLSLPLAQTELLMLREWTSTHPSLGLESNSIAGSKYALTATPSVDYGDLELRIRRTESRTLTYTLHSPNGRFPYRHQSMGSIQLEQMTELRAKLERLIPRLNVHASKFFQRVEDAESQQALHDIENIGIDLYNLLLPEPLKQEYWVLLQRRQQLFQHTDQVPSLIITSDEPWIPWELVRPTKGQQQDSDFLAAEFAVLRHLPGTTPSANLTIRSGHIVMPGLDLTMVKQEQETLADLAQNRFVLASPISTTRGFLDLCHAGNSQLIHIATHGRFQAEDIPLSPIHLEDGEVILQDLNQLRASSVIAEKPFVFLNACHSGRLGIDLIGPEGWAKRFMKDFGVTAFIGSQWEISDRLAADFSHSLYEQLGNGVTLGQALFHARQHIRTAQPGNPTWLAYACYGNPDLQILWGHAS